MITLQQALKDTWYFFKSHLSWICWIILPVLLPVRIFEVVMSWYVDDDQSFTATDWLPLLAEMLVYPLYQGALIAFMLSTVRSQRWSLSAYYSMALRFWFQLMSLYILVSIAAGFGFLLLIVPGVIVVCRVAFAEFICVADERSAFDAFSQSWESTKPVFWLLLQGLFGICIASWLLFYAIEYVVDVLDVWNPVLSVVLGCFYTVVLTLVTIFAFRVFTADPQRLEMLTSGSHPAD